MNIAILGTGMVGRAFALRLLGLGYKVKLGTRNVESTLARTEVDSKGTSPYASFAKENAHIPLQNFNDAIKECGIIINASEGIHSLELFNQLDFQQLAGKIVLDLALPLAFSPNGPPYLAPAFIDNSLGEQLQRLLPQSFVVKTLNTMPVALMLNPKLLEGNHNVFISGDNAEAKARIVTLLQGFGWSKESILDLGGIMSARASEMYANLLFSIADTLGTYDFNIAIVRQTNPCSNTH